MASGRQEDPGSAHEEHAAATAWRNRGDVAARNRLVISITPTIEAIAHKYSNQNASIEDLVQEGVIGAVRASESFDPDRGVRFRTYAAYWIRNFMLMHIMRTHRITKCSVHSGWVWRIRKTVAAGLALTGNEDQAFAYAAAKTGVKEPRLRSLIAELDRHEFSLNTPVHSEDCDAIYQDDLPGCFDDPEEELLARERAEALHEGAARAARALGPREAYVVSHRLAVEREDVEPFKDIGKRWGVSRERVRQIEEHVIDKLQFTLEDTRRKVA